MRFLKLTAAEANESGWSDGMAGMVEGVMVVKHSEKFMRGRKDAEEGGREREREGMRIEKKS